MSDKKNLSTQEDDQSKWPVYECTQSVELTDKNYPEYDALKLEDDGNNTNNTNLPPIILHGYQQRGLVFDEWYETFGLRDNTQKDILEYVTFLFGRSFHTRNPDFAQINVDGNKDGRLKNYHVANGTIQPDFPNGFVEFNSRIESRGNRYWQDIIGYKDRDTFFDNGLEKRNSNLYNTILETNFDDGRIETKLRCENQPNQIQRHVQLHGCFILGLVVDILIAAENDSAAVLLYKKANERYATPFYDLVSMTPNKKLVKDAAELYSYGRTLAPSIFVERLEESVLLNANIQLYK